MKAIWNEQVIAESDKTVVVESNHYFPRDSVKDNFLVASSKTTHCPWKGDAHYFSINVQDSLNQDAAWYYPEPKEAAKEIKDMVAFWRGVKVIE